MFDAKHLRERAARHLAMALQARESGDNNLAEQFTERAAQLFDEADRIEGRIARNPETPLERPAQQQQQPQRDIDKE